MRTQRQIITTVPAPPSAKDREAAQRSEALDQALRFTEGRANTSGNYLGTTGIVEAANTFLRFLEGKPAKVEELASDD
ncbi:hypothetical protein QLQ78_gp42 [Gordonia phage Jojo24]|uniref:Uncharacterized protein n=1 Tax=Gordonia phage Jojo24 TaxID=2859476 RepID=A0AAE7SQC5_9CAUD|nr:hypothetical protein QLQ78_gp42 [Gordonia phage Jojo24]QXO13139.1 hypothetical protein SEA_JOJO24_42 [Gordonia phage Jojo24]